MIHAYGLHLRTGKQWHPAYEAFCQLKQPCVVTMENLQGITGASAEHNRAYIVENEMVFSYLISQMEASDYKACLSKETFGPTGKSKLDGLEHPQLKITAKVMKKKGLCGYQENILQDLLTDIKQSDKVK